MTEVLLPTPVPEPAVDLAAGTPDADTTPRNPATSTLRNKSPPKRSAKDGAVYMNLQYTNSILVRQCGVELGMVETPRRDTWSLLWHDHIVPTDVLRTMHPYQKVNHFPGSCAAIARKDTLGQNLSRVAALFPEDFTFFPRTWTLPHEHRDFQEWMATHEGATYISKPVASTRGKGIYLTRGKNLKPGVSCVLQEYIDPPLLLDGFKFDIRIYVLVMCCDPLVVYLYKEGLVRVCSSPYSPPDPSNAANAFQHITNTAINKHANAQHAILRSMIEVFGALQARGHDVETLWTRIADAIIKTIIVAQPIISHAYNSFFHVPRAPELSQCFELLGFDVMVTTDLRPIVLEVNHAPCLSPSTPIERIIKEALVGDTLRLVNLQPVVRTAATWSTAALAAAHRRRAKQPELGQYELIYPCDDPARYQRFFVGPSVHVASTRSQDRVQAIGSERRKAYERMERGPSASLSLRKVLESPRLGGSQSAGDLDCSRPTTSGDLSSSLPASLPSTGPSLTSSASASSVRPGTSPASGRPSPRGSTAGRRSTSVAGHVTEDGEWSSGGRPGTVTDAGRTNRSLPRRPSPLARASLVSAASESTSGAPAGHVSRGTLRVPRQTRPRAKAFAPRSSSTPPGRARPRIAGRRPAVDVDQGGVGTAQGAEDAAAQRDAFNAISEADYSSALDDALPGSRAGASASDRAAHALSESTPTFLTAAPDDESERAPHPAARAAELAIPDARESSPVPSPTEQRPNDARPARPATTAQGDSAKSASAGAVPVPHPPLASKSSAPGSPSARRIVGRRTPDPKYRLVKDLPRDMTRTPSPVLRTSKVGSPTPASQAPGTPPRTPLQQGKLVVVSPAGGVTQSTQQPLQQSTPPQTPPPQSTPSQPVTDIMARAHLTYNSPPEITGAPAPRNATPADAEVKAVDESVSSPSVPQEASSLLHPMLVTAVSPSFAPPTRPSSRIPGDQPPRHPSPARMPEVAATYKNATLAMRKASRTRMQNKKKSPQKKRS